MVVIVCTLEAMRELAVFVLLAAVGSTSGTDWQCVKISIIPIHPAKRHKDLI
jgi:hypothetical protein